MAKIGTAQIEIKPVVSDEALEEITRRVADAVALGVQHGMVLPPQPAPWVSPTIYPATWPPGTITCNANE